MAAALCRSHDHGFRDSRGRHPRTKDVTSTTFVALRISVSLGSAIRTTLLPEALDPLGELPARAVDPAVARGCQVLRRRHIWPPGAEPLAVNGQSRLAVASVIAATKRSGGKGHLVGNLAADHAQRGAEADPVRIELLLLGGSAHARGKLRAGRTWGTLWSRSRR